MSALPLADFRQLFTTAGSINRITNKDCPGAIDASEASKQKPIEREKKGSKNEVTQPANCNWHVKIQVKTRVYNKSFQKNPS